MQGNLFSQGSQPSANGQFQWAPLPPKLTCLWKKISLARVQGENMLPVSPDSHLRTRVVVPREYVGNSSKLWHVHPVPFPLHFTGFHNQCYTGHKSSLTATHRDIPRVEVDLDGQRPSRSNTVHVCWGLLFYISLEKNSLMFWFDRNKKWYTTSSVTHRNCRSWHVSRKAIFPAILLCILPYLSWCKSAVAALGSVLPAGVNWP